MSVSYGGDSIVFADGSVQSGGWTGYKNRIINGAMQIDQRNAGASVTAASVYTLDRWMAHENTDGAFTVQQVTTAPTGFSYSMKATVTSADTSIGASQNALFVQYIEGYNVADLNYGTANAQTVTLSFWVNSSVTGTFTGTLQNSAADRSYPFSYTINDANTWEQKTITIAGDTSGTWLTTNGIGLRVWIAMAVGSGQSTTAGAWAAGTYYGATGQANWMATVGNTFYITGVQLERGSTASSFEYRPYGTELALCQRYFITTRINTQNSSFFITGQAVTTSRFVIGGVQFPVVMRTAPVTTLYSCNADTSGAVVVYNSTSAAVGSGFSVSSSNPQGLHNRVDGSASLTVGSWYSFTYEANAEL